MAPRALATLAVLGSTSLLIGAGPLPSVQLVQGAEGARRDWFGYRMDVSEGHRVVGAPLTAVGGKLEAGAVYVYRRDAVGRPQRILAPQPKLGGRFGFAVALEEDLLVVGAPGKACAFVYRPDPNGRFEIVATLSPPKEAVRVNGTWFGSAVAVFDGWIAVGAPAQAGASGLDPAGSVHLFREAPDGQWRYQAALHHPGRQAGDGFGMALAGAGDLLIVGAPRDHYEDWWFRGSVHAFRLEAGGEWRHEIELQPEGRPWLWNAFGKAVDVDRRGRVAVGGAGSRWALSGAAMVYHRDEDGRWVGQALRPRLPEGLEPPYRHPSSSTSDLRLVGDRLLLAMPHPGHGFSRPGVLVFAEVDGAWQPEKTLHLPPQNAAPQYWHMSLAGHESEALVGILHHDTSVGARARGSAHLYRLDRSEP